MKFIEVFPFISFLIFSVFITGKTIYLKINDIRVNTKPAKTNKVKYLLRLIFLTIMMVWIFEVSHSVLNISLLPKTFVVALCESHYLQISGVIIIIFSLTLLATTLIQFKKSLRFGMNSDNLGKLITTGIFSLSRNPFFVSIELYFIGITIFFLNPFFIVFTLISIISIHFFILKEEKFMHINYGDEYKNYTSKVRRYF